MCFVQVTVYILEIKEMFGFISSASSLFAKIILFKKLKGLTEIISETTTRVKSIIVGKCVYNNHCSTSLHRDFKMMFYYHMGAQWLSGRVLDSRLAGLSLTGITALCL